MTQAASGATAYDLIDYPSSAVPQCHPSHLAAIARLHGLSPPPVETARVLDIGGGDGVNAMAMAVTLPRARFLSIDLAAAPVARGRALAAAAGIGNVRIEVGDILAAAETLEGPFDYIVSHGVYAWVPAPVRAALLRLIGRVLAPDGVAYLSYNALPGGHFRRLLRDITLHEVGDIADPAARAVAAQRFLTAFAAPREKDQPLLAALRPVAAMTAAKSPGFLLHDELGDCFAPQSLGDLMAQAGANGLRYLNDAAPEMLGGGFPEEEIDDAALIRALQRDDDANLCFFRHSLLVRHGQAPARHPVPAGIAELYFASQAERIGENRFRAAGKEVTLHDAALVGALGAAIAAWPRRLAVRDHVHDDLRLLAMYRLFSEQLIVLHATPFAGVAVAGERPCASLLARTLVAAGQETIVTLNQQTVQFDEPAPRAFLALLDGTRDRAAIAAHWAASPHAAEVSADHALARFAQLPVMMA